MDIEIFRNKKSTALFLLLSLLLELKLFLIRFYDGSSFMLKH
jgi:hypothetical protein